MQEYFADLHIHLGRTSSGKPVKITASNKLTLEAVLEEARDRKGLNMIGVIDCHVPEVLVELRNAVTNGAMSELEGGGIQVGELTLILGAEIELFDENCQGLIHVLTYMPTIESMIRFSNWISKRVKNNTLSTQRVYEKTKVIQQKVRELGGLFIPAHIFTPFKSLYGRGVKKSLKEVFDPALIDAVELGLSADTTMAARLSELENYTFLSNSDAHSTGKIAREYQKIRMKEPTFKELHMALKEEGGRKITANYGLNPQLGKYYKTVCEKCYQMPKSEVAICSSCSHPRFIKGVSTRIKELANVPSLVDSRERPPYIHQVPLDFIPGIGPKTLEKLRNAFGSEMGILHHASKNELEAIVGEQTASLIVAARIGELDFQAGGGGKFGRIGSKTK
ncbi:hypothetical protein FIU87_12660 [Bacillus sp. THAF10]|uniref:endonuclease Q family protein n=1 Tax=Bacillus sp. THAF10 TaxID=2587848 RepID=UPI001268E728|nr:endonuclease Q family protein [Bacillus sp. THAF10]QFT89503.1 hypothetical protein FIU87_12660 [Bacillus sp. THAF10]